MAVILLSLFPLNTLAQTRPASTPVYGYRVIRTFPHDRSAFTQGLIYLDGFLYESTGLNGRSSIRKVQLETGQVLRQENVPSQFFAEGLASWGPTLVQLTWQSNVGFVYDRATLKVKQTFGYRGEGWGLTHDGKKLILSDGTSTLRFLDPQTFQETGRLDVRDGATPAVDLNELEYVKGEIYANVWRSDRIARIRPDTGAVAGWIDLTGLLTAADKAAPTDVLNGIAYDPHNDRLFVTGKLWPKLFEIKVGPRR